MDNFGLKNLRQVELPTDSLPVLLDYDHEYLMRLALLHYANSGICDAIKINTLRQISQSLREDTWLLFRGRNGK